MKKAILRITVVFLLILTAMPVQTAMAATPAVQTNPASSIGTTSAKFNGEVITAPGNGVSGYYGYEYATNQSMANATTVSWGSSPYIGGR